VSHPKSLASLVLPSPFPIQSSFSCQTCPLVWALTSYLSSQRIVELTLFIFSPGNFSFGQPQQQQQQQQPAAPASSGGLFGSTLTAPTSSGGLFSSTAAKPAFGGFGELFCHNPLSQTAVRFVSSKPDVRRSSPSLPLRFLAIQVRHPLPIPLHLLPSSATLLPLLLSQQAHPSSANPNRPNPPNRQPPSSAPLLLPNPLPQEVSLDRNQEEEVSLDLHRLPPLAEGSSARPPSNLKLSPEGSSASSLSPSREGDCSARLLSLSSSSSSRTRWVSRRWASVSLEAV
jgi:hypothetical protein